MEAETDVAEDGAAAQLNRDTVELDEAFGLSIRRLEADACGGHAATGFRIFEPRAELMGVVDRSFVFGGAGFGAAAEPLNLGPHAIAETFLRALLGLEPRLAV